MIGRVVMQSRIRKIFFGLLAVAAALPMLAFSGCESNSQAAHGDRSRESTIPWNRPQSWEGPGVYGSAMGQR